jgi:hypothetical protein
MSSPALVFKISVIIAGDAAESERTGKPMRYRNPAEMAAAIGYPALWDEDEFLAAMFLAYGELAQIQLEELRRLTDRLNRKKN